MSIRIKDCNLYKLVFEKRKNIHETSDDMNNNYMWISDVLFYKKPMNERKPDKISNQKWSLMKSVRDFASV